MAGGQSLCRWGAGRRHVPTLLPPFPSTRRSERDFTDADYATLLSLDAGNKKKTAPSDLVGQLETVKVPLAHRAAATAGRQPRGSGRTDQVTGAALPPLDTCVIWCVGAGRRGQL